MSAPTRSDLRWACLGLAGIALIVAAIREAART